MEPLGNCRWIIPEGFIPGDPQPGDEGALINHEAACILNVADEPAEVAITLFFADREPIGPYRLKVGARRTLHLRFNDLVDPKPVPRETNYSCVIEADVPVVVQHTRLDMRTAKGSLMTTIAYPAG